MRISFETTTSSLGPGKRYVLWMQGCHKRCDGCVNPAGWSIDGGVERSVEELFETISAINDISGITISGGEPFLQFNELKRLIDLIRNNTALDIMLYTGYTVEELDEKFGVDFDHLKPKIDILIDGEYVKELNTGAMYRGSDNQRIFLYTDKYRKYLDKILSSKHRDFSFKITEDGEVYFIGIPPVGFYEEFLKQLGGI